MYIWFGTAVNSRQVNATIKKSVAYCVSTLWKWLLKETENPRDVIQRNYCVVHLDKASIECRGSLMFVSTNNELFSVSSDKGLKLNQIATRGL